MKNASPQVSSLFILKIYILNFLHSKIKNFLVFLISFPISFNLYFLKKEKKYKNKNLKQKKWNKV